MRKPGSSVATGLLTAILLVSCQASVPDAPRPSAVAAGDLLENGREPFAGVLTGGQPTPEQLEAARDYGVGTIINLRQPDEKGAEGEAERVRSLGMEYVSIPVAGAAGLTEENARALAAALEAAGRPVVVHCASGNRVGAMFALRAFHLEGKSAEEAMAIGMAAGLTRLEPAVREHLAAAAGERAVAAPPG